MPAYRYIEIILYSVLYFLPYLLLAYYPFARELRFSRAFTFLVMLVITAFQVGTHIYTANKPEVWWVALLQGFIETVLFILTVKAHWGKSTFTFLMLANISNFVFCAAKCFEGLLFPSLAAEHYRWSNIITLVVSEAVILIPIYFFFKKFYIKALREVTASTVWHYIWLVPLTFYSVWFRNFYFSAEGADILALRPRHLLYTLVINSGALLIYAMVMKLVREQAANDALREKEVQLMIKQKQFETLTERIEEARAAKHDMRQHLHMISAYLADEKYSELEAYVSKLGKSIPENSALSYCSHYAVNALLQYFSGVAREHGIAFSVHIELPEHISIPDDVLAVLLGNLLENATEACTAEKSPMLTVRGKTDGNAVFFKVVNTFTGKLKKSPNGLYLSTKHEGRGIGLRSVRGITSDYNGILKIEPHDGTFSVSVMLMLPEQA